MTRAGSLCLKRNGMKFNLFIHNNTDSDPTKEQWHDFFSTAKGSGIFSGGSEISNQICMGKKPVQYITKSIGGYMRFEAENEYLVFQLLEKHPVFMQGGTLELCETPES